MMSRSNSELLEPPTLSVVVRICTDKELRDLDQTYVLVIVHM